jgi:hypothetical protein
MYKRKIVTYHRNGVYNILLYMFHAFICIVINAHIMHAPGNAPRLTPFLRLECDNRFAPPRELAITQNTTKASSVPIVLRIYLVKRVLYHEDQASLEQPHSSLTPPTLLARRSLAPSPSSGDGRLGGLSPVVCNIASSVAHPGVESS